MRRQSSDSARLRTGDHLTALLGQVVIEDELRDLCRLSGTCLTDEDEDLRLLVQLEKLVALLVHGQVAARLEDAHVLARERTAGEGVVGAVLGSHGLLGRRGMTREASEAVALRCRVVPVAEVRVALVLAVGVFGLDALGAAVVVI